jgi:hypothetical protein
MSTFQTTVIETLASTQSTPTFSNLAPTIEAKPVSSAQIIAAGGLTLPGIPTFSDFDSQRQWIREHMAAAFRSMGRQGLAEGLAGHISVRDPEFSDRFWMNP